MVTLETLVVKLQVHPLMVVPLKALLAVRLLALAMVLLLVTGEPPSSNGASINGVTTAITGVVAVAGYFVF
ncbi:hypothetical protein Godav_010411 [Gossypium davidsonii]|uniref:Uncharacterized protein n=2 Tax=Gossypium TaxID=3633 RepID=A0A7J8SGI1_GOSDV|nr:hypothetical protein [Gossypium davidsonii]MBA0660728.1 hypothetical protein [Gossypium klotzschianum]